MREKAWFLWPLLHRNLLGMERVKRAVEEMKSHGLNKSRWMGPGRAATALADGDVR